MNVGDLNAEKASVISPQNDDELSDILGECPRATETFVRRETGWMVAICRRILRDDALAKDCVQNAFVNVFKNLRAFKGDSKLKTWMYRIVVNQALMDLRKRRRLQEEPIDGLLPEFYENNCRVEREDSSAKTPEQLLDRKQTDGLIIAAIDRLPENYRIVLLLRDIEEMSTIETAEVLEMTESNVKVSLHRARAALKKLLEPVI